MSPSFTFVSGLLFGLAGSLHCAGYCGAIASSLASMAHDRTSTRVARAGVLVVPHVARIGIYIAFGAAVGASVAGFGSIARIGGFRTVLSTLASVSLLWIGASIAGWLPASARPARLFDKLRALSLVRISSSAMMLPLGIAWGCAPCAMVYSALLNASLTGSAIAAAVFMFGFGLATVPPLLTLGATQIALRSRFALDERRGLQRAIGTVLIVLALINLAFLESGPLVEMCLTR